MKHRIRLLCLALACLFLLTSGCALSSPYKDGVYSAQLPEFAESGWKEMVEVTIEGGNLTKVNWDAIYRDDSIPIRKKQYSKSGLYGMLMAGAVGEWYDQATVAEQLVLKNGPSALKLTEDGHLDGITGCTIHVDAFAQLLLDCLDQARK